MSITAACVETAPGPGGGSSSIQMGRVFTNGLLGCLYGAAVIGGANTIVILMGDNTKSNFYRVKYGFAVGTIIGLVYGTITGALGQPLIPTMGDSTQPEAPSKTFNRSVYYALNGLQFKKSKNGFLVYTNLYIKRF